MSKPENDFQKGARSYLWILRSLLIPIFCIMAVAGIYGCTQKVAESETGTAPGSPSPTPIPSPSPSPAPSPLPAPSPASWTPTPGSLPDGTWHNPAAEPDPTHAGAYGGIDYAPNGDLYFFYETGTYPNEDLQNVIRRSASSTWSAQYYVSSRMRTAHLLFDSNQPYLAGESGGSVSVLTSTTYANNFPQTVTWTSASLPYYQALDSNPDTLGSYGPAYLVKDSGNFHLFHTYLWYASVTGAELYGMNLMSQSSGVWPADGLQGTPLDSNNLVNYYFYPRGANGAYSNGSGTFLAFSKIALKSTDGAASFSQIMHSGTASNDLTGVFASCKNQTDGSILIANSYSGNIAIWGTQDFAVSISKLGTVSGTPMRGAMACIKNLVILAYTNGPGSVNESYIDVVKSTDGGSTWSAPVTLIDATNGGVSSTRTIGSLGLAASASGDLTLGYSVVSGNTHLGAYIKEFY